MANLSKRQQEVISKIIHIGKQQGATENQIKYAIQAAKIESSFGKNKENIPVEGRKKTSAKGIYQYVDATWQVHDGDPLNDDDNIRAFYKDLERTDKRFDAHRAKRLEDPQAYARLPYDEKVPEHITKDQYRYIKHHDGGSARGDAFQPGGSGPNGQPKAINLYKKELEKPAHDNAAVIADEIMQKQNIQKAKPSSLGPTSQVQEAFNWDSLFLTPEQQEAKQKGEPITTSAKTIAGWFKKK